ncbi:MAG: 4'-phosphopantetheinyl transferase superfamily protein [Bacteroidetes bacterium]|nr:4'-phosphopantetheinyl transferase superfamily protein [Bacteroidota bacterium]MBL0016316.1 4'-phosphopantetheinyl transferase superfamily protein [Bacteroidota bacterium]MBP6638648.1 4'-phosphopantetheinyl transferase superfamily protein [Bacteroidia bacterium]MBP6721202.1 4'-phosphopantetheinyl transferase superfamily protein [Bacteroidia bacterium]MBP8074209.1 4'-phosphopantetheinyl transferase superfamily protein [Bacteroidia bacterium]
MPFIALPDIDRQVLLGMWKVNEPEDYFRARLNIYENEDRILKGISHPQKRLEWLSSRLCLKELLQIRHKVESLNAPTGQPYLSDHSFNISYSHSNMYSGAIASDQCLVSMDLEDLSKERNLKTRFLFMHPSELEYFDRSTDMRAFFLIWSAKETLYKIYTKKGIVFKENLLINQEQKQIEQSGTVSGILKADGIEKVYTIYYTFFPGVLLTYTFDPIV